VTDEQRSPGNSLVENSCVISIAALNSSRDPIMKNFLSIILQLILFLIVFFAGSLFPPFHIEHILSTGPAGTRIFVADGFLLMLALFIVFLLIEVLRKRIVTSGRWTVAAFILATALGLAMKFGFLTRSAY
jgi:hypothetical protein